MDYIFKNFSRIKTDIKLLNFLSRLIVVTKSQSEDKLKSIIQSGHIDFGENRVQEAKKKWKNIKNQFLNIQLHMIGKLQTNKVKEALEVFDYIHSLDSIKLAGVLKAEETKTKKKIRYFIQVNVGDEVQKSGVHESKLQDLLSYCRQQPTLDVIGLMCIPPNNLDAQIFFNKLKSLSILNNLKELSMGMSNDYERAIKSGATFVRVGSAIFNNT